MSPAAQSPAPTARAVLAANMIRLRRERGWSQETLAFECGLHRTFVAHCERQVRNISLDNLERIANALGVPVYALLMPTGMASPSKASEAFTWSKSVRRCSWRVWSFSSWPYSRRASGA